MDASLAEVTFEAGLQPGGAVICACAANDSMQCLLCLQGARPIP